MVKNKLEYKSLDSEFSETSDSSNFLENGDEEHLDILNEDEKSEENLKIDFKGFEYKSSKLVLPDTKLIHSEKLKVKSKFSIENILGLNQEQSVTEQDKDGKDVKCDLFVKPIPVLATALYKQYSQGEMNILHLDYYQINWKSSQN